MSDTPAMLERLAETKLVAALAAVVTDRPVVGFWSPVPDGKVKENRRSVVEVRVLPREGEGFDSDAVTLHAVVAVTGSFEDDPAGSLLPAVFEQVMGVLGGWDSDDDALAAAMDIAGVFRCDAVMFAPGGDCGWDDAQKVWFATIMLDVKGCIISG